MFKTKSLFKNLTRSSFDSFKAEETQKQIEECIESYEKEVDVKLDMLGKQDKVFDQVLVTAKEEEEQQLKNETKELQAKLKEERRRSTNLELQVNLLPMSRL